MNENGESAHFHATIEANKERMEGKWGTAGWLQPSYAKVLRQLDAVLGQWRMALAMHEPHRTSNLLIRHSQQVSVLAHQNPGWCPPGLFGGDILDRNKEDGDE